MIRPITGEFKLDDYDLIIHPELTLSEFKTANLPVFKMDTSSKRGWTSFQLNGSIDGMKAQFGIYFKLEKLHLFMWFPSETEQRYWLEPNRMSNWLTKATGISPPYQYEWGYIDTEPDEKDGRASITVATKYNLWDCGITDFNSYHESRRKYFEVLEERAKHIAARKQLNN